ncbi:MAG TPA: cold shock domain-containing protein [Parasegetibacter sp.]|jgi:cold shock CspA family protein
MAKSKQSFNKKEKEKKRLKQKQDKKEKMEDRKANAKKGKSLEDMMAYIDEDGNITDTPPDPTNKRTFNADDIQIAVPKQVDDDDPVRLGTVNFFNDEKGFGFILDQQTNERIFVHANNLSEPVKEGDKINYEVESGPRGLSAINVVKLK